MLAFSCSITWKVAWEIPIDFTAPAWALQISFTYLSADDAAKYFCCKEVSRIEVPSSVHSHDSLHGFVVIDGKFFLVYAGNGKAMITAKLRDKGYKVDGASRNARYCALGFRPDFAGGCSGCAGWHQEFMLAPYLHVIGQGLGGGCIHFAASHYRFPP